MTIDDTSCTTNGLVKELIKIVVADEMTQFKYLHKNLVNKLNATLMGADTYFYDSVMVALPFGKVFSYKVDTLEPKLTYKDKDWLVANTNPVILDEFGKADIFLKGSYDLHIFDSLDNLIEIRKNVMTALELEEVVNIREDARTFETFLNGATTTQVPRRLAPPTNTLSYYENLFVDAVSDGDKDLQDAISKIGFTIVDSFESGATITTRTQALRYAASGSLYRWAGDLPKVIPASSTPLTSGGIGQTGWLVVSDVALWSELKSETGADLVGVADKTVLDMLTPYTEHVFLETFRGVGFSDSQTINAALTHIRTNLAGKTTRLVFQANKTYVYDTTGDIRGISNLTIDLNGATLKRADAVVTKTTLTEAIGVGQGTLIVVAIPANWQVGDMLAAYSGNTNAQVTKGVAVITSINRAVNKVYTNGGLGTTATWTALIPSGATIAKKFSCFAGDASNGISAAINTQVHVINGTIDGNAMNQENYSWFFNIEMGMNGNGCVVRNITFKDIAGECIVGHGIDVNHCRFNYLYGSAFHLSVHDDTVALGSISRFSNNYVDRVCLATNVVNGHSEGAVTFSWGAGRLIIDNNEFKNGSEGVLGGFGIEVENPDKWLIVKNNMCSNFKSVFYLLTAAQSAVILSDNIFANCGANEGTLMLLSADINSSVGHNAFVEGTGAGGRQRIRESILGTAKTKHPTSVAHFGSDVTGLDPSRMSGVAGITHTSSAYLALGCSDTGSAGFSYTTPTGTQAGSFYTAWEAATKKYTLLGNIVGAKVHISKAAFKLDTSTTVFMPVYEDNATALTGGLTAGDVYRTSLGVLMVCF